MRAPSAVRRSARNARGPASGAPVAVSSDLQQFVRFKPSSRGVRMHTCAAACEVLSTGVTNGRGLFISGNGAQSVQLNLTQPTRISGTARAVSDYYSPVYDLIGSAFVRYKLHKVVIHYQPQAKADADGRLVFAYAKDPEHPLVTNTAITQANLLAVSDSIAFMPWKSWSMDVTHLQDDTLYYTYSDPATGGTAAIFNERFSDFGIMGCVTDVVGGAVIKCGVIYLELDVELVEFCPIVLVSPSSKIASAKRMIRSVEGAEVKQRTVWNGFEIDVEKVREEGGSPGFWGRLFDALEDDDDKYRFVTAVDREAALRNGMSEPEPIDSRCPASILRQIVETAGPHLFVSLHRNRGPVVEASDDVSPTKSKLRVVRRECEELVRAIEKVDTRWYKFFRSQWKEMIEDDPEQLLKELRERLASLHAE